MLKSPVLLVESCWSPVFSWLMELWMVFTIQCHIPNADPVIFFTETARLQSGWLWPDVIIGAVDPHSVSWSWRSSLIKIYVSWVQSSFHLLDNAGIQWYNTQATPAFGLIDAWSTCVLREKSWLNQRKGGISPIFSPCLRRRPELPETLSGVALACG